MKLNMADVGWDWKEFQNEKTIILSTSIQSAIYSDYHLIRFFAKFGKIETYLRLNAIKTCIAIAKYVSPSDAKHAASDKSMNYYGMEMQKIDDYPKYGQFDKCLYSYKKADEIMQILQRKLLDNDDKTTQSIDEGNQTDDDGMNIVLCKNCNSEHCQPKECLTKAWIKDQLKTESMIPAPNGDSFEDEILQKPGSDVVDSGLAETDSSNSASNSDAEFHNKSVYLVHVANSSTVFVRSADEEDDRAYTKFIKTVHKQSKQSINLDETPKLGEIISAPFEGLYCRGRIDYISSYSNYAMVDFIDFGHVEKVDLTEMRLLSTELTKAKPTLKAITIEGVAKNDAEAKRFLGKLVRMKTILFLEHKNGNFEIFDKKSRASVNEYLLNGRKVRKSRSDTTKSTESNQGTRDNQKVKQEPQMKKITYLSPNDPNVSAYIVGNSTIRDGYIHAVQKDHLNQLKEFDEHVNLVGHEMKSKPPYAAPISGELCLVKLRGEYFRAKCTGKSIGARMQFELIDYGDIAYVRNQDVRRLPDELLHPCVTIKCVLKVMPSVKIKMCDKTEKMLQEQWPLYGKIELNSVIIQK